MPRSLPAPDSRSYSLHIALNDDDGSAPGAALLAP